MNRLDIAYKKEVKNQIMEMIIIFQMSNITNYYSTSIQKVMKKEDKREQETQAQIKVELDLQQVITLTQDLLRDLIQSEGSQCQSIFNSQQVPTISLQAYLRRIHKYTKFSPQCLIIAIIYLDRYNMSESQFSLNWNNVHRILLTCLMIAVKFHDDIYFDNLTYQRGGGVSTSQLFKFEVQVFQKIGFNAFVEEEEYDALVQRLCSVYNEEEES